MGSVRRSSDDPGQARDVGRWEFERALRGVHLPLTTRGVLWALVSRMDVDGTTRSSPHLGSVAQIAADLDVKPRVVKEHLRRALDDGFVRREGQSYTGHVAPWILCLPPGEGTSHATPSPATKGTCHTSPVEQEGTCHTSERGRATRQRGDVPHVPHRDLRDLRDLPPPPRLDSDAPSPPTREERERSDLVEWIVLEAGIPPEDAREVVRRAQSDPTTQHSAEGRLRASPDYRRHVLDEIREDARRSNAESRMCPHGQADGRQILGKGENRSRICGDCEVESPSDSTAADEARRSA